ncbi:hypothetical protein SOVF_196620, partial [Spinacia oleracea]
LSLRPPSPTAAELYLLPDGTNSGLSSSRTVRLPDMRLPMLYTLSWPDSCSKITWPRLDLCK